MDAYTDILMESSYFPSNGKIKRYLDGSYSISSFYNKASSSFKSGHYTTIFSYNVKSYAKLLYRFLKKYSYMQCDKINSILVCGLGNENFIVDSLGNYTCDKLTPIKNVLYTLTPSVYGKTGIESYKIVKSVIKSLSPSIVFAIDSIATKDKKKLCNCIQITTAGITPGGGVNNNTRALNSDSLNIPIVAIGFPVILTEKEEYITTYNIDEYIKIASDIISKAITKFATRI